MDEWWRGGVIYQIYPRSFADSNNDGVGDLNGIASRIEYVKRLGVDGVWVSPFFKSPMKDFGYDVSDYKNIDPVFGSLTDFDALLQKIHGAGLKLIIDQVYSHTSDQHPWFKESRKSKSNPKANWYVWADAKSDGAPPNNWISLFGGQAWTWDTRRRQYYLHNFLAEQPDLNFHNPEVRAAITDVAKFWLDRGVDGFRLDVANFYYCDDKLRDNPAKHPGTALARPYLYQQHVYDRSRPETLSFIKELRRQTDRYDKKMMVAEIVSDSPFERCVEYTGPDELHTAYNFQFLESRKLSAKLIRDALQPWSDAGAWPSWSFSNHDAPRVRTRWGGEHAGDDFTKLLLGVLMCLRGTIFLYQGEELGLPQAEVPYDKLQDPEGIRFWPENLGRDGCRTPMPWIHDAVNAGFSTVEPWLPVDPKHYGLAASLQENEQASILNMARRFIAFRKSHAALCVGDISFVDTPEPILMILRSFKEEQLVCVFNLSDYEQTVRIPESSRDLDYGLKGIVKRTTAILPSFGGLVISVSTE